MGMDYRTDLDGVIWEDLELLFRAAGLGGRTGDKLRRAFEHSQAVCLAFHGTRLVGVSRALSDGEYHTLIYDVAVHPDYQRRGIGSELVRSLLAQQPTWRAMLVAGEEVQPFYGRLGFAPYPDVMARLDWDRLYDVSAPSDCGEEEDR
jgi:GNAT superfamily N-acetyltransferase